MIAKNTEDYKKAQKIANLLVDYSKKTRRYDNTLFNLGVELIGKFVYEISQLGTFASEVAKSVDKTIDPFGYQVARISDKQAWILACAAVENNIEF